MLLLLLLLLLLWVVHHICPSLLPARWAGRTCHRYGGQTTMKALAPTTNLYDLLHACPKQWALTRPSIYVTGTSKARPTMPTGQQHSVLLSLITHKTEIPFLPFLSSIPSSSSSTRRAHGGSIASGRNSRVKIPPSIPSTI